MLTGRFETMDPELGKIFDPGTLHKYVYANGNPTNRVDPLGLDAFEYSADLQVVFKTHGLDHLLAEGLELTQPEVEAYVEQLVREIIQEEGVSPGAIIDIPFLMSQLGNVPWAARIFIIADALIEVTTYFPINK